ncbi:hypothetical protein CSPAE12_02695, partial [Colletotrichum incanum]
THRFRRPRLHLYSERKSTTEPVWLHHSKQCDHSFLAPSRRPPPPKGRFALVPGMVHKSGKRLTRCYSSSTSLARTPGVSSNQTHI